MRRERLTALKNRLPSPPGVLGREEYFSTAILVPLIIINGEEHLLFQKRAPHIRQGNEICFPGGHFDRDVDNTYLDTALREVWEELGVGPNDIEIVGQLDTLVSPRGLIVDCFLGVLAIDRITDLQLDKSEVDEVFTVPIVWFQQNPPEIYYSRVEMQSSYIDDDGVSRVLLPVDELGLPAKYKKNRSEWLKRVVVYKREPDIIWGLTAAVVENLILKIFPAPATLEK